jgi:hypothetical protein
VANYTSPCQNDQYEVAYEWRQPQLCNPLLPGALTAPPATVTLPCKACPAGFTRLDENGQVRDAGHSLTLASSTH